MEICESAFHATRGPGQETFFNVADQIGLGQEAFEVSPVGPGRVGSGRVGRGIQRRVGTDHPVQTRPARSDSYNARIFPFHPWIKKYNT